MSFPEIRLQTRCPLCYDTRYINIVRSRILDSSDLVCQSCYDDAFSAYDHSSSPEVSTQENSKTIDLTQLSDIQSVAPTKIFSMTTPEVIDLTK